MKRASPHATSRDFARRVVLWQREHGRHDLPWQNTRDPYRIWLSEIMLQQTQVTTVLPYYARFVEAFPDVRALADAPLARVLELWSGLGYYRRAHHLHAAAHAVVHEHGGRFPTDSAALEALPGIGRSTAAAIAAFSSGEAAPILDGNVKRVLARHRGIEGWPGDPSVQSSLWKVAETLMRAASFDTHADIGAYTQGLMDIGATICTRTPHCLACPVADDCIAYRDGRVDALPTPRPRKVLPQRSTTILIVRRNDEIMLEERPPVGIWAGLWSFPEVDADEDVTRYMLTRFNAQTQAIRTLPPLTHTFTHFALTMHPLEVVTSGWPPSVQHGATRWFKRDTAHAAAVPAPVRKLLRRYA
jgi:A/G-specific adenine glycosylase